MPVASRSAVEPVLRVDLHDLEDGVGITGLHESLPCRRPAPGPAAIRWPRPPRAGQPTRWARPGSTPPIKPPPESSTMSPVKPLSIALLIDAFVEATKMVMKPTRPTPIINAEALAAVRFGLRMAFSRASSPVMPRSRGSGAPITRLSGSDTVRPEDGHSEEHEQRAGAHHQHRLRDAAEQPDAAAPRCRDRAPPARRRRAASTRTRCCRRRRAASRRSAAPWRPCARARAPRGP